VSDLQAAGVSAEGEIREAHYGHVAAAILKAAQDHDARIIVLGSSSRTDLPRMPLGSVSTRLLHMATRPVLIVPDRPPRPSQPFALSTPWQLWAALPSGQHAIKLASDSPSADVTSLPRRHHGICHPTGATCVTRHRALDSTAPAGARQSYRAQALACAIVTAARPCRWPEVSIHRRQLARGIEKQAPVRSTDM
jgi:hypothetical protein